MSTTHLEIPDLVFTAYSLPGEYGNHYRHVDDPWVGLVFVARNATLGIPDLENIMTDPVIRTHMGDFYVGGPYRWNPHSSSYWHRNEPHYNPEGSQCGILIAQRSVYMPDCQRQPNTPICIMAQGRLYQFKVHDVYTQCRDLRRLMGCHKCPDLGETCLHRYLRLPLVQSFLPGFGDAHLDLTSESFKKALVQQQLHWSDLEESFKSWKSNVAGFTYISPVLASESPTKPGQTVDAPYTLAFDYLEDAQEALSARTRAGVETRRTKRVECTKCYFGGTGYKNTPAPCDKWRPRRCQHGAWTEAQIRDATIPPFEKRLTRDGLSMKDFYGVLAIAGQPFRRPTEEGGHAKWCVSKLQFRDNYTDSGVLLKRTAATHRDTSEVLTVVQLRGVLPDDLRRRFDEAPTLSPELTASAMHLMVCNRVKPYTCMAGCIREVAPDISHVAMDGLYRLELGYWMTTYWRTMYFNGLESVANYFNGLPAFNIAHEQEDLGFQFHVWPRR